MDDLDAKRDRILKAALACRVELVGYARSLLGDYAMAEDAVQEAMLVVVRKFDQFQEGTSILAWCRSIVRVQVLRMKQQRQREQTLVERLLDDAIDAAFEEFHAAQGREDAELWRPALERCLQQVPERARRVLEARFTEELGYPEIAERIGMTIEAVRKALFRIKQQLRACLETKLRGAS